MKYIIHNYAGGQDDVEHTVTSAEVARVLRSECGDAILESERTGEPVYVAEYGITILPPVVGEQG